MGRPPETPEQILARVDRSGGPTACWPWTGSRFESGCGYGRHGARLAHRVVWGLLKAEPVPELIRHTCDNPPCCNPAHLIEGTKLDNMHDKVVRGRWKGRYAAQITPEMVVAARRRVTAGERIIDLAKEFGVTKVPLASATRGTTFAWIVDPPPLKTCRIPGSQTGDRNNARRRPPCAP